MASSTTVKRRKGSPNFVFNCFPSQLKLWSHAIDASGVAKGSWARTCFNAVASGELPCDFTERVGLRGRFDGEEHDRGQFQLRATEEEKQAWRDAAGREGLELSEWCRQVLTYVANLGLKGARKNAANCG